MYRIGYAYTLELANHKSSTNRELLYREYLSSIELLDMSYRTIQLKGRYTRLYFDNRSQSFYNKAILNISNNCYARKVGLSCRSWYFQ